MAKKILVLVSIGLSLTGLSGGCGKSDGNRVDKPGVKIRYAPLRARIRGLDPMDIGDVISSAVAGQAYETLFQYHHLKRPYQLVPGLAEAMPEISPDGLIYTVKIRKDVTFFDDPCFPNGKGRPLTAADFIYAWKRIANIKNISKNWWIFENKIVGLDEFREYTKTLTLKKEVDYARPVTGLTAVDDHTLRITLKKPWPQITFLLAHLPTAAVAKEAVDFYGDRFNILTVGTGPFRLDSWKGNTLVFSKNPTFRKELYPVEGEPGDQAAGYLADAGKPLPLIDGIVYYIIEEGGPYWLTFLEGKTDSLGDRMPNDFYAQYITPDHKLSADLQSKGIALTVQEDPSTYWFGFNMDDPVVGKNLPLRRAMSLAFDRDEFNRIVNAGRTRPARGVFPPMFREYNPTLENPWTEFNLARARELLREAEKIAGGRISVSLSIQGTDTFYRQMGEYFKRTMVSLGVDIRLDFNDWPTHQDKVNKKMVQMFSLGWLADYPDASTFMEIFYGPNATPGPNGFNYRNPAFDDLYRTAVAMPDTPQRLARYRQMEKILCDDCPAIFAYHRVNYVPFYKYLKNYKYNVFNPEIMKYQDIDLPIRKKLVGR